jgi:glucose-6-phosphate 1-dehydrogenase
MFGVTGDLAKRALLPALDQLQRQGKLGIPVIGVARSDWDDDELRDYARKSIEEFGPDGLDEESFADLAKSLSYVRGEYDDDDTYERLRIELDGAKHPLAYLAVPPSVFEHVIKGLAHAGLTKGGRVIVEKPFGRDLESARFLNKCLLQYFKEEEILRMDHFMGKDSVLDLLVFRFDNLILEPLWNRHYIERVEITLAEDFGVEGRGAFYEEVGALRDVVQNHLLELVMLVAMEPPAASDHGALRDEKVKLLRAMRSFDPKRMVRGQHEGYLEEKGVDPGSKVETYVAVESYIDNWRWSGVPFHLRAGKKMATTMTEVLVQFRSPPDPLFRDPSLPSPAANRFLFRLKPDEGISLTIQIKEAGERLVSTPVDLDYSYDENREKLQETAYERLIGDAIEGDPALFARSDAIEEAWRVVMPVLEAPPSLHTYAPGTWGPKEADDLIECGWHNRIPVSESREDV